MPHTGEVPSHAGRTTMKRFLTGLAILITVAALIVGCTVKSNPDLNTTGKGTGSEETPTFSLAWSEYPSWSVFGVANELGLIDGAAGKLGELEKKYGVDIELKEAGYDSCLNMFGSGDCDAVCITNMDALIVCGAKDGRDGVAIMPTSTSKGADACLVTEAVADIEGLKTHPVYGLKGTVSEYCFVRCLEKAGFDEKDFQFTNQDPAIAAQNMQGRAETHQAIMVWNPFVLQTLNDRGDVRILFDSSEIPGEIVDMIVIGKDSLAKPGADKFVNAVAAAFYAVSDAIDGEEGDEILVALGKKFSNLGLDQMKTVVEQTVFYKTPATARQLMAGDDFKATMKTVTDFCVSHGLVESPSVGYGEDSGEVNLRFDGSHINP